MPWIEHFGPSAALGTLAPYLKQHAPLWTVECRYEYLKVWRDLGAVYELVAATPMRGEVLYGVQLYPDRRDAGRQRIEQWFAEWQLSSAGSDLDRADATVLLDYIREHAEQVAASLASGYDAVGFTTVFNQLFANLLVAQRLKQLNPEVTIIFGGTQVHGRSGHALAAEYPFVDHVVQGDGELALCRLLDSIASGEAIGERVIEAPEVADLDVLPDPQYDEYFRLADELGIGAALPIEGSRGCWWDRSTRTKNPKNACYFCLGNKGSYRQKTPARIAAEMQRQQQRYETAHFLFLDNILRPHGVPELATAIEQQLRSTCTFLYEVRASVGPYELLRLWQAGCTAVQLGVEGLSTSYLKRIGKGTTTILNLQAMKTCYELGISCHANLITGFPGATGEEIEETAATIRRYACAYWPPLSVSPFVPSAGSAVGLMSEAFGVVLQRSQELRGLLPEEVCRRLDLGNEVADDTTTQWQPVVEAIAEWVTLHQSLLIRNDGFHFMKKPLFYVDGGFFLEIEDNRRGDTKCLALDRLQRQIYLYCMDIKTESKILKAFADLAERQQLTAVLAALVDADLMYTESQRYLSLAVAAQPHLAAQRISLSRTGDSAARG